RRIALAALTLLLVSAIVFTITNMLPGDAAQELLGQNATPQAVAALRAELGLDRPAPLRYFDWLGALVQGEPGRSLANKVPVAGTVGARRANTPLDGGLAR